MSTTTEPDCGSSSCIFLSTGGMRTNGPCRCYENAGFHGSAVMAAKQMLREVLLLRAKVAAIESPWINPSVELPTIPDGERLVKVLIQLDEQRGYRGHPEAAYFDPSEQRERDHWQLADGSGNTYPANYIAGWMYTPKNKVESVIPIQSIPSEEA